MKQIIVKETNIKEIFNLILENEGISRVEISRKAGLSKAAVSVLVDELVTKGLVKPPGEKARSGGLNVPGRKPVNLYINGGRMLFAAIELKQKEFIGALYDLSGKELNSFAQSIEYKKGFGEKIKTALNAALRPFDKTALRALCAAVPARINIREESLNLSSVLEQAPGCGLMPELKSIAPDLPLLVANDSSATAYAEYKYVRHGGTSDMVYFYIGEGVGAGILLNGRIFSGEIGHMTLDPRGPLCACGKRGCVETMLTKPAILRRFGASSYADVRSALKKKDPRLFMEAEKLARQIAFCVSNVVCVFNPTDIVLGGGIEEMGNGFLKMIEKNLEIAGNPGLALLPSQSFGYTKTAKNDGLKSLYSYYVKNVLTILGGEKKTLYLWA
jgi:predicted NBD/HSP70 family sugar kinase